MNSSSEKTPKKPQNKQLFPKWRPAAILVFDPPRRMATYLRGAWELNLLFNLQKPISFPEHARSQVRGGHSSGEIELIQACDWLTADSTLDFQREFYACLAIVAKYK